MVNWKVEENKIAWVYWYWLNSFACFFKILLLLFFFNSFFLFRKRKHFIPWLLLNILFRVCLSLSPCIQGIPLILRKGRAYYVEWILHRNVWLKMLHTCDWRCYIRVTEDVTLTLQEQDGFDINFLIIKSTYAICSSFP